MTDKKQNDKQPPKSRDYAKVEEEIQMEELPEHLRDLEDEAEEGNETEAAASEDDLTQEIASLKEHLLRTLADSENLRKRLEREKEETAKYATTNMARDLVSVSDNMNRALESIKPEDLDGNPALKTIFDGIKLVEGELQSTLSKHGIKSIDPMGENFDHNFHQAMFEVADSPEPQGTVVQVVQTGYRIHDRLLRPALVGISKGNGATKDKGNTYIKA